MATAVKIPDLGTNTDEVTLVEWIKHEGDPVKRGDALCEVETDKAVDVLESVAEGILLRQVVPSGSEITSGTVIAYIGSQDETISEPESTHSHGEQKSEPVETFAENGNVPAVPPIVRNLAKRMGVDLSSVTGTGPNGRITSEDVTRASEEQCQGNVERGTRLPKQQLSVARRVSRSNREIPVINLTATVEVTGIMRLRERNGKGNSRKPAYDSIFLYAVSRIIKDFKGFMRHVEGDNAIVHDAVDLCVAISRDHELYTPVIRKADSLSLEEIDTIVRGLAEKTRAGNLRPEDMAGGSLTVSNLGMYPIRFFNVIIPPEQSAALAIGSIEEQPTFRDGKIMPVPVVNIVLSVDHRSINGSEAAEFLKQLKNTLETL